MSYFFPKNSNNWTVGTQDQYDVIQTRNIDVSTENTIKLAKQPIVLYTNTQDSDFGNVKAIVNDYIVTTGNVFKLDPTVGTMTEQTTTSMPDIGIASDAVYYLGEMVVSSSQTSGTDSVVGYNGSSWTSRVTGLTNTLPHPMAVFENFRTLCIGNGNVVWQTTAAGYSQDSSNTLTLPAEYTVTWLRWRNGNMYIGTRNTTGGSARLFVWNGVGTSTGVGWSISCDWIYSGVDFANSIVVLTSAGQLLRFNGGGFDEIAHLPVYETDYSWSKANAAAQSTLGRCDNRGMIAYGDILYLNIDGSVQGNPDITFLHNQPSGLWVFNPSVGLYHYSGYAYTQFTTHTITDLNSSILTIGTHTLKTGDQIRASSVSNITGLSNNRDYYVIEDMPTTIKLARSAADAQAWRHITLSGTPSGDTLKSNGNNYGATSTLVPGAVARITNTNQFTQFFGSTILFSGACQNNADTTIKTLMAPGTGRNRGYIVTSIADSINIASYASIKEFFQKLFLETRNILQETDSIVIKYRTRKKYGLPTPTRYTGTATWTSDTVFTIDSTKQDIKSISVGDEIEVIEGSGSGCTAHITAIDTSTNTYSVTIDEAIPGVSASDTAQIIVDNWKKLKTVTNDIETIADEFAETLFDNISSSKIQLKLEMRGRSVGIKKAILLTKTDKSLD